jgi:ATP-dependent DNA helicase RecG
VRFVDSSREEALGRIGIATIGDLVEHWPFRYLDLTTTLPLAQVKQGEATVVGNGPPHQRKRPRPRLSIVEVAIGDETGSLLGVWFNQPWMADRFVEGERVAFAGKVELDFGMHRITAPFVEKLGAEAVRRVPGRVVPVHRTTEGLDHELAPAIGGAAVDDYADVPDHCRYRCGSPGSHVTEGVSAPCTSGFEYRRGRRGPKAASPTTSCSSAARFPLATFGSATGVRGTLTPLAVLPSPAWPRRYPSELTDDQSRGDPEILADMASTRPMNRLLARRRRHREDDRSRSRSRRVADSGTQAAMMAPTEVLAVQYAEKVGPLLDTVG